MNALTRMQVAAHRGFHESLPENSLVAFEAAIDAGADAIEFDVRVTRDGVAVVTHWLECELSVEGLDGYLFEHDFSELRAAPLKGSPSGRKLHMSSLDEVLQALAGRIGLEIEIKGPSAALAERVGAALLPPRRHWESMEVTTIQPARLHAL
jgi:glycerophosphoryl diester phosphodiesterase